MEVYISDPLKSKLLTQYTHPFLIIKLIKSYFIMTKTSHRQKFDKNINFQFQDQSFYSTFIRHVHLSYAGKLSQLIEHLDIVSKPALQYEWLMLYQIHDFNTQNMKHYKIGIPPYGGQIFVWSKSGQKKRSKISNSFKLHGQAFYFLSNSLNNFQQFSLITDSSNQILYGITYFVKDLVVCLPFHIIGSEKPCPLNINSQIKPLLQRTCYVRYGGSYCTGFVLNDKCVISARHLLSSQNHKAGIQIGIRFYPYNQETVGVIKRVGKQSVDIIQIFFQNKGIKNQFTLLYQNRDSDYDKLLGKEVIALGFGKYAFSPGIFNKIDLILPTLETGVISKIINLGHSEVFIKTDASLYNGFSGCGIWLGKQCIGMAVFILKNRNNNSNFNRHNFSYSVQFILKLLSKNQKQSLISQIDGLLKNFDKIQTRFKVPLMPKL